MAMTTCKECGTDISTKAEACPKCGAKAVKTSPVAKGCLVILAVFVGLGVLGSLVGDKERRQSDSNAAGGGAAQSAAVAEPPQVVPLGTLLGQYRDNEVRADSLYKGKTIQTTGRVDDVKRDIMGSIYVTVGTGAQFEIPQVQCFFDDDAASTVSNLSKGTKVTVQGRVDGLMMNVLVKDCQLATK